MIDPIAVLRRKRGEISLVLARLRDEVARLEADLLDLETAEAVLVRIGQSPSAGEKIAGESPSRANSRPKSQRQFVIEALQQCEPIWVRSGTIVELIQQKWGVSVPERSLRPLLTSLKREHVIARDGRLIALQSRLALGANRDRAPS